MEISTLFIGLSLALGFFEMNSGHTDSTCGLKQGPGFTEVRAGPGINPEASSVICKLQGTAHCPAFAVDGDYVIGGVFSMHNSILIVKHNYTAMPEPLRCTGRLV